MRMSEHVALAWWPRRQQYPAAPLGGCGCASLERASKENFNLKIDFRSLVPVSIITLRSLAMSSDMVSRPYGSVGSRMNADPTVAGSNPVAPCLITF